MGDDTRERVGDNVKKGKGVVKGVKMVGPGLGDGRERSVQNPGRGMKSYC